MNQSLTEIEISQRLRQVYLANLEIGGFFPDFFTWYKSVKVLYPAGSGGVVLNASVDNPSVWWVTIYCPGDMPSFSHLKRLVQLAILGGCETLIANFNLHRYRAIDYRAAKVLEYTVQRIGFKKWGSNSYAVRI